MSTIRRGLRTVRRWVGLLFLFAGALGGATALPGFFALAMGDASATAVNQSIIRLIFAFVALLIGSYLTPSE